MPKNEEYTKHKVATDALETLGMLIPPNSGRDAIHLAVEPVVAGMTLLPGQRIRLADGKAWRANIIPMSRGKDDAIGIVDPFLAAAVHEGDRFWLVVLPRTITSLRHVWSHPAFPDEPASKYHDDKEDEHYFGADPAYRVKAMSEVWLKDQIANNESLRGLTMDELIQAATAYLDRGERYYGPASNTFSGGESVPPGFWKHYSQITGRKVEFEDEYDGEFFSCTC